MKIIITPYFGLPFVWYT